MNPTPGGSGAVVRRTIERMLRQRGRARQFERLFETNVVPMMILDSERRWVASNVAAKLMLRLTTADLRGRRVEDFTPPELHPTMLELWRRLMDLGATEGDYEIGFPDHSRLKVVFSAVRNVLPGQHLVVFAPAHWSDEELAAAEQEDVGAAQSPLSPREREVLALIGAGAGQERIAHELSISVTTVRTHARNALRKLGARNRPHAVALSLRKGLIDPPAQLADESLGPEEPSPS